MAKAMGANGYSIREPKDFDKIDYQKICSYPAYPTVLDVYIDPEELSPPSVNQAMNKNLGIDKS